MGLDDAMDRMRQRIAQAADKEAEEERVRVSAIATGVRNAEALVREALERLKARTSEPPVLMVEWRESRWGRRRVEVLDGLWNVGPAYVNGAGVIYDGNWGVTRVLSRRELGQIKHSPGSADIAKANEAYWRSGLSGGELLAFRSEGLGTEPLDMAVGMAVARSATCEGLSGDVDNYRLDIPFGWDLPMFSHRFTVTLGGEVFVNEGTEPEYGNGPHVKLEDHIARSILRAGRPSYIPT